MEETSNCSIEFWGAAGNVTGSCYLLRVRDKKILIDCGLYQEHDLKDRNWEDFPIDPAQIDAVVVTHAHLDHCGRIPRLVKQGFNGPIYCTPATADIMKIVMMDCAKINEEDADFKQRRHEKEGRQGPHPVEPLYTQDDVTAVFPFITPVQFGKLLRFNHFLSFDFHCVGHILGASFVSFKIEQEEAGLPPKVLVFSGDVGRSNMPIINDPSPIDEADYIVCESTYGDRIHGPQADIPDQLAEIINDTVKRGGNIIIPSFAIERTQELIFFLAQLLKQNRIPHLRTFVDSPMAVKVTEIFARHPYLFDEQTMKLIRTTKLPGLTFVRKISDSKSINHISGSAIIIAGSGMCTGGRIRHHLVHHISNAASTVLFVGYQAQNTLGRQILEGEKNVRILGEMQTVRAKIEHLDGFSAHADKNELTDWLKTIQGKKPSKLFVTHGEQEQADAFAEHIRETLKWDAIVPEYLQKIEL